MAAIAWPASPSVGTTVSSDDGSVTFVCTQTSPKEVWDVESTDKVIYGQPVGSVHWCPYENPYPGCLMLDDTRQVISRSTYSDLWAWISTNAGAGLAASEVAAEDGQFGPGDGSTTFTLPKAAGYVLRVRGGVDPDARVLGDVQLDAVQGHHHAVEILARAAGGGGGNTYTYDGYGGASTIENSGVLGPITDGVNGIPRTASESRSVNIAWNLCIVAFHTVDDPAQVNAASVTAEQVAQGSRITALENAVTFYNLEVAAGWLNNTEHSVAHGLGRVPIPIQAFAECTVAIHGYAVGDRAVLGLTDHSNNDGAAVEFGLFYYVDDTNAHIVPGTSTMRYRRRDTNARSTIPRDNFKLVMVLA